MGRVPRVDIGGEVYHVLNRANARMQIFFKEEEYKLLEDIFEQAANKFAMRILAYCIMPNHFHLVLHPKKDGDLQKFMQWVTLTHTQRWHAANGSTGTGHLYQGRYKSFLIEQDGHLLTVLRYVERNPLRAKLVKKLADWNYSSFQKKAFISVWPITRPANYTKFIEMPLTATELESMRYSVNRGKPFGSTAWTDKMLDRYSLDITTRERGRPRKGT